MSSGGELLGEANLGVLYHIPQIAFVISDYMTLKVSKDDQIRQQAFGYDDRIEESNLPR